MRDAITTAMEVAGMMLICATVALVIGSLAFGLGSTGVVLLAAGALEGRKQ